MRYTRFVTALAIIATMVPPRPSCGQTPRESLLVTPQWLSEHLRDPGLVILHVGPRAAYDTAHIAGARYLELSQIGPHDHDSPTGLMLQMPATDTLRARLEALGISDNSNVVVVQAARYVSAATRVLFTLDHAGLGARTALLDGGLAAWTAAGLPITAEVLAPRQGRLSPLRLKDNVVTAEFVRDNARKPGFVLIDARAAGFYDGVQEGGPQAARKRGHIPGAVSLPYNSLGNDRDEFLAAGELAEKFRAAGVKAGDTVAAYCHIGQQATVVIFAARTLGLDVKLFDGSFEDWAHRGWPVEVPGTGR
jgi:thiosulfate/3-mercaptopyruvate sulfurtransferase